ncbi:MAG: N-acetyltransferase family protein [Oscillospiraceae bacterium]
MITIRPATADDIARIEEIYNAIHTAEEAGNVSIGWARGVYPARATAQAGLEAGELFVLEDDGTVYAAGRINREQVPVYAQVPWAHDVPPEQVLVLHTLVVDPTAGGHGYGTQFMHFYEQYARTHACPELRIDTNAKNVNARRLYAHLGYREVATAPCNFNGIDGVALVCLEKWLGTEA